MLQINVMQDWISYHVASLDVQFWNNEVYTQVHSGTKAYKNNF